MGGLLPEEAARRLKWTLRELESKVASGEVESMRVGIGIGTPMIPLAEVDRIERLADNVL